MRIFDCFVRKYNPCHLQYHDHYFGVFSYVFFSFSYLETMLVWLHDHYNVYPFSLSLL